MRVVWGDLPAFSPRPLPFAELLLAMWVVDVTRVERTRGTWFCLFALAGPQRGMVFTNIPDVVGSKKKGPEAMYRQTALAAFRVYSLYFPSVGQRWNLPLPWKNIWCQLVHARF